MHTASGHWMARDTASSASHVGLHTSRSTSISSSNRKHDPRVLIASTATAAACADSLMSFVSLPLGKIAWSLSSTAGLLACVVTCMGAQHASKRTPRPWLWNRMLAMCKSQVVLKELRYPGRYCVQSCMRCARWLSDVASHSLSAAFPGPPIAAHSWKGVAKLEHVDPGICLPSFLAWDCFRLQTSLHKVDAIKATSGYSMQGGP